MIRIAWGAAAALGVFVLLVLGFVIFANTEPGRSAVVSLLNPLLGGNVTIHGLSGRFPDRPTAERVEISDDHGVWLKLEHVSARWSPLQLLRNRISAHSISAESATLLRLPIPGPSSGGSSPPMDFKRVSIGRLTISEALASRPIVLTVDGTVYYTSKSEFAGVLHARRLDGQGEYALRGSLKDSDLLGVARIREPGGGLIAGLLGLPDLGPLAVDAGAIGPQDNDRVHVAMTAGALRADARGSLDLLHRVANVSFSANSPAVHLRPDLSWRSLDMGGEMRGAFDAPDVLAHLAVQDITASGGSVHSLRADVQGRRGDIRATGAATGVRLPGAHPDLFSASPVTFEAHAVLGAPTRVLDLSFSHALLSLSGHVAATDDSAQGVFALKLPSLAPLGAAGGFDVQGRANLNAVVTARSPRSSVALDGNVHLDGGNSDVVRILGRDARIAGLASIESGDVNISQAALDGTGAAVTASGHWRGGDWNVAWSAVLKDLSRIVQTLKGNVMIGGRIVGRGDMLSTNAEGSGNIATKGFASGPLRFSARAKGLPGLPSGSIDLSGTLDRSPFALTALLSQQPKGEWKLALDKADWRSAHAHGDLSTPQSLSALTGKIELHVDKLADLQPLLGESISGRLDGSLDFVRSRANVDIAAQELNFGDAHVASLRISGEINTPLTKPSATLTYVASGLADNGVTGDLKGTLNGQQDALGLAFSADLRAPNGQAVQLVAGATADIPRREISLARYDVRSNGLSAHLLAPAHFDLANGIEVDALKLVSGQSEIDVAGRLSPRLDATVSVRNATGNLLGAFMPGALAQGSLSGSAKLAGTLAAPLGTATLAGKSLQITTDTGAAAPPADLLATAVLHATSATVHATIHSGDRVQLALSGDVPLRPAGALNLHATGKENLAILDPILNAEGRSLHGEIVLDATVTGTLPKPRVAGSAQLSKGEFQDYVRGIHIQGMSASLDARGDSIAIDNFSARAGGGTITGNGSIDLAAPGEPMTLAIAAKNAKPVSNDVLNATLDGNIKLSGRLAQQLTLSGNVNVLRADVDIPDSLSSGVAVLKVRGRGEPPSPPPIPLTLDLTLRSGGQLFVRGHGVDAEMSGSVHIGGTTLAPDVTGGFDLRRGNLSLAGQTLDFTSGRLTFDGGSLRERIDPALEFVAQTTAGGTTATLNVTGHASAPKIALTSTPPLPQDEVLAHLLFQQNTTQLSPWQIAQLGQALASLGGMGGLGDPLARVRKSLGLDRLAVTTAGATGTQTAVEAGRYVAHNVYVGAKQGVSGAGGTQAIVQVDLTKHLKLQTQISSTNAPTPVSPGTTPVDTGSNLGLSYQFEY
jgi:translocation and assembly module TamB